MQSASDDGAPVKTSDSDEEEVKRLRQHFKQFVCYTYFKNVNIGNPNCILSTTSICSCCGTRVINTQGQYLHYVDRGESQQPSLFNNFPQGYFVFPGETSESFRKDNPYFDSSWDVLELKEKNIPITIAWKDI